MTINDVNAEAIFQPQRYSKGTLLTSYTLPLYCIEIVLLYCRVRQEHHYLWHVCLVNVKLQQAAKYCSYNVALFVSTASHGNQESQLHCERHAYVLWRQWRHQFRIWYPILEHDWIHTAHSHNNDWRILARWKNQHHSWSYYRYACEVKVSSSLYAAGQLMTIKLCWFCFCPSKVTLYNCSKTCKPGQQLRLHDKKCCRHCIPCADGEFSPGNGECFIYSNVSRQWDSFQVKF